VKYLYVLASDNTDFYSEQLLISITSLRLHTPCAFVSLLIDNNTESNLINSKVGKNILNNIDELKSINIDDIFNKKARSRWLKTSMRQHIAGDFLYIDCDTIISDNLSDIDNVDAELALVLDHHLLLSSLSKANLQVDDRTCIKLGFVYNFKSDLFFNSGLMLCRDCVIVNDFFNEWHKLWLHCFEKESLNDQPSLNQANYLLNFPIKELEGIWNCQIEYDTGINYFFNAKIIHYFTTKDEKRIYLLPNQDMINNIRETGLVHQELKQMLLNSKKFLSKNLRVGIINENIRNFHDSILYIVSKRIYQSRIGNCIELLLSFIRKIYLKSRKNI
jgi:hypothetical protein